MATPTLILGNNDWATKDGKLLGYYQNKGYYFPREFTFSRTSEGTYIGRDGLIKTADAGIARVDFQNNPNGALLLEPARTNIGLWSEDISQWNLSFATVQDGFTDPFGGNKAFQVDFAPEVDGTWPSFIRQGVTTFADVVHTSALYCKYVDIQYLKFVLDGNSAPMVFDLTDGSVIENDTSGTWYVKSPEVTDMGNGWWKIVFYRNETAFGSNKPNMYFFVGNNALDTLNPNVGSVQVAFAQVEQGSYPTSYIKTEASTVNRGIDDIAYSSLQNGVLGTDSGTWFMHYQWLNQIGGATSAVHIRKSAWNNESFYLYNYENTVRIGSTTPVETLCFHTLTGDEVGKPVKVALSWDAGVYQKAYVNGVDRSAANIGDATAYAFTHLGLGNVSGLTANGLIWEMRFYPTALTDTELEQLTS